MLNYKKHKTNFNRLYLSMEMQGLSRKQLKTESKLDSIRTLVAKESLIFFAEMRFEKYMN